MRIVVAGAGLAGLRAAQAARAAGHAGELTIIGDERHPPYTRPPLSKELLAGDADECALPGVDRFEATWRLGTRAAGVDVAARTLVLADGEVVDYDRLIVATGCRARGWPGDGGDLDGVHLLRGLDDARALRAALADRPRLAIIGAGFVGCEVAATARRRDVPVTLIDIAEQPMVGLGPELGARCAALHRDHGVDLRLGRGVAGLRGEAGRVTGVQLADGSVIDAELVLVALGAVPNTEWLRGSAIELDAAGGVLCDATLTTSDPDVLAAGDVAAWIHPAGGSIAGDRIRVEHWTTAAEHGRVAGANAVADAGARAVHATAPYFWSDQYDVKIQSVGLPARAARIEIVEEGDGRLAAEGYGGDGRLVAAVTFNHARRLAEYRRRLAAESATGPARADDTPLREPVTS